MKKTVIYSFLILCCGILLACSNQKVLDEKDQSTTPNKEEAVKAYIYAKNIELWESVFVSAKRYNEVAGKKICNDEEVELCRKVGKKICTYYFKESEVIEGELLKDEVVQYYSSLKYNIEKKTWETKFGREETNDIEKLVSQGKVESIGKIKVDYPNSYFPKAEISEYKKKILAEIKEYMEKYSSTIRKKGKYQIFIKDFSEADVGTDIMVKNDEPKGVTDRLFIIGIIGIVLSSVTLVYCEGYFLGYKILDFWQLPYETEEEVLNKVTWLKENEVYLKN